MEPSIGNLRQSIVMEPSIGNLRQSIVMEPCIGNLRQSIVMEPSIGNPVSWIRSDSFVNINIIATWHIISCCFFIFSFCFLFSEIKIYSNVQTPKKKTREFRSTMLIENRIYIREEFKESLGMIFFSPFQPEREFKVYKSC